MTLIYKENKHVSKILFNSLINDGTRKIFTTGSNKNQTKTCSLRWTKFLCISIHRTHCHAVDMETGTSLWAFHKLISISVEINM